MLLDCQNLHIFFIKHPFVFRLSFIINIFSIFRLHLDNFRSSSETLPSPLLRLHLDPSIHITDPLLLIPADLFDHARPIFQAIQFHVVHNIFQGQFWIRKVLRCPFSKRTATGIPSNSTRDDKRSIRNCFYSKSGVSPPKKKSKPFEPVACALTKDLSLTEKIRKFDYKAVTF